MPLIHQACPECGHEWHDIAMVHCVRCLPERGRIVYGVRATPRPGPVHEATLGQIREQAEEAKKYVT